LPSLWSLGLPAPVANMCAVHGGKLPFMPPKKKGKKKSAAKSTKPKRASKARAVGKSKTKTPPQKRIRKKARPRKRTRTPSLNAEAEWKREFQSRNTTSSGRTVRRQSADFEGLSRVERADSESVDELVEEGNLFEAGAVAGVEEADNADEQEVQTREIQEDDVPEEYLDEE